MKNYDTRNLKSLQEKVLKFLNESPLSNYQLCNETGISETSLGKYRNRASNPNFANSKVLLNYFENNKKSEIEVQLPEQNDIHDSESIPLIPFEYAAGFGEDNDGISLNDCEKYKIPEFKNIGAEFLVRVGGSSMYPKYSSGDILACKKIYDILFFQWGKIYVIDSSQGQLVKRVCRHDDENMVWLVSDNKEKYEPFAIPKSDIRSLSIVVGVLRME